MKRFLLSSLAVALGLLFLCDLSFAQRTMEAMDLTPPVIIDVTKPWTDSNLDVTAGTPIAIIVRGIASTQAVNVNTFGSWAGPEGYPSSHDPRHLMPDAPDQSVIGKIGESGSPFYVGRAKLLVPESSGRLYLGYNDSPGHFDDNFGYYVAFVFSTSSPGTGLAEENSTSIASQSLDQNYPNPFNPNTTIQFRVDKTANVRLEIFDQLGRRVRMMLDEEKTPGRYGVTWDGKDDLGKTVPSGVYYCRLKMNSEVLQKKMILIR